LILTEKGNQMPTYEYECKSCGHTFEAFQSMSDEPIKACPECGSDIRRLIFGGTGVIFKGSGFYVTDKGKKPAGGTGKPAKSGESASSGGTEQSPPAPASKSGDAASAGGEAKPAAKSA
jgi:putative FmdB family regulatory protein